MKYHINYSDNNFKKSQKLNTLSAKKFDSFDFYINYSPNEIKQDFYQKNSRILNQKKGSGFWLWKPYFILETLKQAKIGDIIIYTDSGMVFIDNPQYLIDLIENHNQDIIPFSSPFLEKTYTKRDAFILMDCDEIEYSESNHYLASVIVTKKTEFSLNFFEEYLKFGCDERIISDLDNTLGFPNYEGFAAHRHDQSIFSLLSKQKSLIPFRNPSQWGNELKSEFNNSPYPQVVESTRKRDKNLSFWIQKTNKISKKIFNS